jgi:hypothetical protein
MCEKMLGERCEPVGHDDVRVGADRQGDALVCQAPCELGILDNRHAVIDTLNAQRVEGDGDVLGSYGRVLAGVACQAQPGPPSEVVGGPKTAQVHASLGRVHSDANDEVG